MKPALILLAATVFAAGCGGGSSKSSQSTTTKFQYSDEVTQNYMKSCTESPQATQAYCRCTLDKLSEKVSMKDFQQIGLSGGKIPMRVRNVIVRAARDCRSKL